MSSSFVFAPTDTIIADTLSDTDMPRHAAPGALEGHVKIIFAEIQAGENETLSPFQCMLSIRAEANKAITLLKAYREPFRRNLLGANAQIERVSNLTAPTERDLQALDDWCKQAKAELEKFPRDVKEFEQLSDSYQDNVFHRFVVKFKGRRFWEIHDCLSDIELGLMGLVDVVQDITHALKRLNKIRQQLRQYLSDTSSTSSYSRLSPNTATGGQHGPRINADTPSPTPDDLASMPNSLTMLEAPEMPTLAQPRGIVGSFSIIEEQVTQRAEYKRAITQAAGQYIANNAPTGPAQLGSVIRRSGRSVPRIFTGSFDELERSLDKLSTVSDKSDFQDRYVEPPFPTHPNISVNVRDFAEPVIRQRPVNLQMQNGAILARRPNAKVPTRAQQHIQMQTNAGTQPAFPVNQHTAAAVQQTTQSTSGPQVSLPQQQVALVTVSDTALRSAPISQPAGTTSSLRLSSRHRENTI